ncbi:MAG: galactokinase [Firmicutes bacterium]|nr:galactokinase [Bacillota bacterium]
MTNRLSSELEQMRRATEGALEAAVDTPVKTVAAPGRVNLIGEHTDYNDGFVLPVAIDRWVVMSGRRRPGREVVAHALDRQERALFSLDELDPSLARNLPDWARYVAGTLWSLELEGLRLGGMELAFTGSVPQGMGLSSSAALEVATGFLALRIHGLELPRLRLAQVGQRAENQYVGVNCGIMDQFASALGAAGRALLLDCRSLEYRLLPVPQGIAFFVVHPPQGRTLAGSGYNRRRQECEAAARLLAGERPGIRALRDATADDLKVLASRAGERYEDHEVANLYRRARHVVEENSRVLALARAMEEDDFAAVGRLVSQSHGSLRDLFEVSTPAFDRWVERLAGLPGCLGARMVGGGFGGSILAVVRREEAELFRRAAASLDEGGEAVRLFPCRPVDGVGEVGRGSENR